MGMGRGPASANGSVAITDQLKLLPAELLHVLRSARLVHKCEQLVVRQARQDALPEINRMDEEECRRRSCRGTVDKGLCRWWNAFGCRLSFQAFLHGLPHDVAGTATAQNNHLSPQHRIQIFRNDYGPMHKALASPVVPAEHLEVPISKN
jgi:hypothetical protein